jgi:hypothetical protein
MFNTLVTPVLAWQQPRTRSVPAARPPRPLPKPERRDWRDFAGEEAWESAILAFLREHRREVVPYWKLVNQVVAESAQPDRWEVRYATRQVLQAVKSLVRARRVLRYRQRFLAVLDTGDEVIPLDIYYALPTKTATGRCAADSATQLRAVENAQNQS